VELVLHMAQIADLRTLPGQVRALFLVARRGQQSPQPCRERGGRNTDRMERTRVANDHARQSLVLAQVASLRAPDPCPTGPHPGLDPVDRALEPPLERRLDLDLTPVIDLVA